MPEKVCVFFCANYFDMQAEREFLHALVFPHIEKWFAAKRGITVEFLDVGRIHQEDFDNLKRVLDAVERCRPYFLCVLGQRYGEGLKIVPKEARVAYPWLKHAKKGMSRLHLEIMHAVLNNPTRGDKSFFYLRGSRFLQHVPAEMLAKYQAGSPQEKARHGGVVAAVQASGRPVCYYPLEWDYQRCQITGFAALGRAIANDLETAITGNSKPTLGEWLSPSMKAGSAALNLNRTTVRPGTDEPRQRGKSRVLAAVLKPGIIDENVQFTVYRPKTVQPEKWYDLLAFAHLSEKPAGALEDEPDPVEEVKRQAAGILGKQAVHYQDMTQDSTHAVPRQGQITFVPAVAGIFFDPPRATFTWQESIRRVDFRMLASAGLDGKMARGRLTVFLGAIILADVPLVIRVDRRHLPTKIKEPMEAAHARRYRKIFASYSHKDLTIVQQFESYFKTIGDEYLRDWNHLRAGEIWNAKLMQMIEEADLFQLFWSTNSMKSDFVRQEWEYALALNRANFVRPTYWENPMPRSQYPTLPPPDLARLHFQGIATTPLPSIFPDLDAAEDYSYNSPQVKAKKEAAAAEERDIFDTDFEVAALDDSELVAEDESGSQVVALDEEEDAETAADDADGAVADDAEVDEESCDFSDLDQDVQVEEEDADVEVDADEEEECVRSEFADFNDVVVAMDDVDDPSEMKKGKKEKLVALLLVALVFLLYLILRYWR